MGGLGCYSRDRGCMVSRITITLTLLAEKLLDNISISNQGLPNIRTLIKILMGRVVFR